MLKGQSMELKKYNSKSKQMKNDNIFFPRIKMSQFHWFKYDTWLQDISLCLSGDNQYLAIWPTLRLLISTIHNIQYKNLTSVSW